MSARYPDPRRTTKPVAHSATRSDRCQENRAERGWSARRSWRQHPLSGASPQSEISPTACRKFLILDCPVLLSLIALAWRLFNARRIDQATRCAPVPREKCPLGAQGGTSPGDESSAACRVVYRALANGALRALSRRQCVGHAFSSTQTGSWKPFVRIAGRPFSSDLRVRRLRSVCLAIYDLFG